jgi:hypothetical protein
VNQGGTADKVYYSSLTEILFSVKDFFARISRVRRLCKQASCLHESRLTKAYDEQRELGRRSLTSLLMRASEKVQGLKAGVMLA